MSQRSRSLLGLDDHPSPSYSLQATEDYLHQDNERRLDILAEKAKVFVEVSNDIHNEVQESNRLVDNLTAGMLNANNLLKGALQKVGDLVKSGNNQSLFYLVGGIVFVFLVLYLIVSNLFFSTSPSTPTDVS